MGIALFFRFSIRYTKGMNQKSDKERLKTLYDQVDDYFIKTYMDLENEEKLEQKIRVLEQLIAGKKPPEIEEYDDVLDAYPKEESFVLESLDDVLKNL